MGRIGAPVGTIEALSIHRVLPHTTQPCCGLFSAHKNKSKRNVSVQCNEYYFCVNMSPRTRLLHCTCNTRALKARRCSLLVVHLQWGGEKTKAAEWENAHSSPTTNNMMIKVPIWQYIQTLFNPLGVIVRINPYVTHAVLWSPIFANSLTFLSGFWQFDSQDNFLLETCVF